MKGEEDATAGGPSFVRTLLIATEAALVVTLLVLWILVEEVRSTGNLVVLFLYSFPSEFLFGLVPHEPVLLYYGELHPAWVVAVVAGIGTALAERMNYSFLRYFTDLGSFEGLRKGRMVARVGELFGRAPFRAIVVAAFTPVPFFPIRFLVVLHGYPVWRYVAAVFLARTPRFFLLAALGGFFRLPTWSLVALFAVMIVPLYLPFLRRWRSAPDGEEAAR